MPKKIDPQVKERCTRLVLDHLAEYPSLTAACTAVARREGVGYRSRPLRAPQPRAATNIGAAENLGRFTERYWEAASCALLCTCCANNITVLLVPPGPVLAHATVAFRSATSASPRVLTPTERDVPRLYLGSVARRLPARGGPLWQEDAKIRS